MSFRLVATRAAHSRRQVKKLNFVRRRDRKPDAASSPAAVAAAAAAADLEWNVVRREVRELRNGWTPPPEVAPDLPFSVRRTANGFLPVYSKLGPNRPTSTIVRHATGDIDQLVAGLAGVAPGAPVLTRLGTVEVRGDHTRGIRRWLAGLGL